MNNKEQKELQKDWILVILAAVIGFCVNLAASSTYDIYVEGFEWKKSLIFLISVFLSLFIGGFFVYIFENITELKNNKNHNSFWGVTLGYIKSIFRKNKINIVNDIYPLEKFYIYFSPYTAHAIEIDKVVYPTLEHAYQCQRYTDKKIIEEIIKAHSPVKAWEVSSRYKSFQISEFKDEEYKLKVMKMLMRLKAEQHKEIRQALLESGDLKIIKHIVTYPPGDGFWDDGEDGNGQNHIGKLWMEIREELKND